jgi:Rrf2 family nitric oxide-sensitive transcriptional repressor
MPVSGKGDLRVRLTQFSNFSVRVLMYAGLNDGRLSAVPEMARAYGVSYDHLKKAATELCRLGYLETVRGRGGGFRLAMHPETIRIGEVIRQTEGDVRLVECFDAAVNTCPLIGLCQLRVALHEALAAFFAVLDRYTLADFIRSPEQLSPVLGLERPRVVAPAEEGSFARR